MKTKLKSLLGILFMSALFFSCSHSSGNKNQGGDDPKLPKTKWLVLLYMDGDNNLNDVLYCDLNEVERGMYENPDKDDAGNLRVVALWDGCDFQSNNDEGEESVFETNPGFAACDVHNIASTRLLELAPDSRSLTAKGGGDYVAFELSPATVDLTDTVDWIEGGEVDMASETTLENYLKWAKNHYNAENIILQFSNHGGGPRSAGINGQNYGRRSMCWDDTNGGSSFLKTADVTTALKAAGYGPGKKVKMIMEDVCLGGSVEEAYQLKDYSEYYVGSPNNIPGMGFNYISFISSLTSTADIKTVGETLIDSYKNYYTKSDTYWTSVLNENHDYFEGMNEKEISLYYPSASTLSFIDLSKVNAVKDAVNELASFILDNANMSDTRIKYSRSEGQFYDSQTETDIPEDAFFVPIIYAIQYWAAYYGDPIYYEGSFGLLKDLGYMIAVMEDEFKYSWPQLLEKTADVKRALNEAIIACWRDGYNEVPTYYKTSSNSEGYLSPDCGCGLTINCSVWVATGSGSVGYGFASWYQNELAFGKDCANWTNLIQAWWE